MSLLILRELDHHDEKAFEKLLEDWDESPGFNMLFGLLEGMSFSRFLKICEDMKDESKVSGEAVPGTSLYAFVDGEIVGKVSVRHKLNESLKNVGGHIGYGVVLNHRGKGHATIMLKEALTYCSTLGLSKVLLTCDDTNLASIRVIEKNGGVFEKLFDPKNGGTLKRHYWITISPSSPLH
jgi:predicted acetyltransferase